MVRRQWIPVMVILVALGALSGAAFALADGGDAPSAPTREASDLYSEGMTLEQISELSQGKAGSVAPPCPNDEDVTKLKEAGLPVGPCDPFPEEGAPVLPPADAPIEDRQGPDDPICVTVTGIDADHQVRLPCDVGVELIGTSEAEIQGEQCVAVTYIPMRGVEEVTETLCPSAPKSPRGATMGIAPSAGQSVHDDVVHGGEQ